MESLTQDFQVNLQYSYHIILSLGGRESIGRNHLDNHLEYLKIHTN